MQDTLSLGDNLRLLNGLSYRYDQANSETFYGGRVSSQIWRLFSQWSGMPANTGCCRAGMLEDVEGSGSSFSPRLAVNYLFNPSTACARSIRRQCGHRACTKTTSTGATGSAT